MIIARKRVLEFLQVSLLTSSAILFTACGSGTGPVENASNDTGSNSPPAETPTSPAPEPAPAPTPEPTPAPEPAPTAALPTACGQGSGNTISVSWDPPGFYSDDTPLNANDIASYKLHYGTESRSYAIVINTNDPAITDCTLSGLPSDTYYFAVTVILNDGRESEYSGEILRSI